MVFQNVQGVEMHNSIEWRPGRGDRIKFWEDMWIDGEESLAAKYPRLPNLMPTKPSYSAHGRQ